MFAQLIESIRLEAQTKSQQSSGLSAVARRTRIDRTAAWHQPEYGPPGTAQRKKYDRFQVRHADSDFQDKLKGRESDFKHSPQGHRRSMRIRAKERALDILRAKQKQGRENEPLKVKLGQAARRRRTR